MAVYNKIKFKCHKQGQNELYFNQWWFGCNRIKDILKDIFYDCLLVIDLHQEIYCPGYPWLFPDPCTDWYTFTKSVMTIKWSISLFCMNILFNQEFIVNVLLEMKIVWVRFTLRQFTNGSFSAFSKCTSSP